MAVPYHRFPHRCIAAGALALPPTLALDATGSYGRGSRGSAAHRAGDAGLCSMSHIRKLVFTEQDEPPIDQAEADRQTASLGGLAIALFLVVIGLFLVQQLHRESILEDCLLSGAANCSVIAAVP